MIKVHHKYRLSVTVQLFVHFFIFFLAICGFSVPQPGTEPMLPVVEAQSHNHRTTREVSLWLFLISQP